MLFMCAVLVGVLLNTVIDKAEAVRATSETIVYQMPGAAPQTTKVNIGSTTYRCAESCGISDYKKKFRNGGFGYGSGTNIAKTYRQPRRTMRMLSRKANVVIARWESATGNNAPYGGRYYVRKLHSQATCTARDGLIYSRNRMCHSWDPDSFGNITFREAKALVGLSFCGGGLAMGIKKSPSRDPRMMLLFGISNCGWFLFDKLTG